MNTLYHIQFRKKHPAGTRKACLILIRAHFANKQEEHTGHVQIGEIIYETNPNSGDMGQ